MSMSDSVMTPFSHEIIRTRGLHVNVQSERVHTSAVKYETRTIVCSLSQSQVTEGTHTKLSTTMCSEGKSGIHRSRAQCPSMCHQLTTKYQVSVSNTVTEATGFRSVPTSIHKYPCSVSCRVPRCPVPSQHISHWLRPNELPQNTFPKTLWIS